ncbi:MAG: TIGR03790 family protein [Pirellulaceae bacterium]|nr:TIGR03790 family protein [Pirellulaceae bacterium]
MAGLTSSEVVVVVNGGSLNSRTLANHFVKLRGIPSANVIVLKDVPNSESTTAEKFRELILKPLFSELTQRGLDKHIQCVAYSADFPTSIDIKNDLGKFNDSRQIYTPAASINSMTYLYELSQTANPLYVTADINFYARQPMERYFENPAGGAIEDEWKAIQSSIRQRNHEEAAKQLVDLARKLPAQFPLHYLAAAQAALAKEPETAIKLLESAINAGWNSRGFLRRDERFESLRNRDDYQLLELTLDDDLGKWQPTAGFNQRVFWAPNGVMLLPNAEGKAPGMRYLMSIVLGVTRGSGNTLTEAIAALKRSAAADFTHPEGTFYFCSTDNVRSTTRAPLFADAVEELKKLGFDAEVVRTPLPLKKKSMLGAQFGEAVFDWAKYGSTLVPGAIADNLTSFGGALTHPSQTKLTELIKVGAAGSCGTVIEPYALAFKFPTPYLYVHYAQGASLVEAFYQSVSGPYQLLIVGDPLCQPFSNAPQASLDSSLRILESPGSVQIQPDLSGPTYDDWLQLPAPPAKRTAALAPSRLAFQVDGSAPTAATAQPSYNLDMRDFSPGYHEIHVMQIAEDPLNQRSSQMLPVWIGPVDQVSLSVAAPSSASQGDKPLASDKPTASLRSGPIQLTVQAPEQSSQVTVWHHWEQLVSLENPSGTRHELSVDPAKLGMGPVRLQAKAQTAEGKWIASMPVWVEVTP